MRRIPAEANTFPSNSGCKKKNEELPGTELTGARMETPKFNGSLEKPYSQEIGSQGIDPGIRFIMQSPLPISEYGEIIGNVPECVLKPKIFLLRIRDMLSLSWTLWL